MPLFVFHCPSGHEFEELLAGKEIPDEFTCPECGMPGKRQRVYVINWKWGRKARQDMPNAGSAYLKQR